MNRNPLQEKTNRLWPFHYCGQLIFSSAGWSALYESPFPIFRFLAEIGPTNRLRYAQKIGYKR